MGYRGLSGQSAIEYLMTYGWMLLVVAVTGGAIFATVGGQNLESTSGFTGSDVQIDNFGLTDNDDLQLEMRDSTGEGSTVTAINITDQSSGEFIYKEYSSNNEINVGESEIFNLPNVTESDGSNTLRVQVIYSSGGLENMEVSGTISGSLAVDETAVSETDDTGDSGGGDDGSNDGSNDGDEGGSGGAADTWSEPVSTAPSCNNYPGKYNGSGTESDPYIIMNSSGLQCMNQSLDSDYALGQNINASGTEKWNYNSTKGVYRGFDPVGDVSPTEIYLGVPDIYNGTFNGRKRIIEGIHMREIDEGYTLGGGTNTTSVFSATGSGAVIKKVGLTKVSIHGSLGAPISGLNSGNITGVFTTGRVEGLALGGISVVNFGRINNSYSRVEISNSSDLFSSDNGGIVSSNNGTISNSYATGLNSYETTLDNRGGLVGSNEQIGTISSSYWDVESTNVSEGIGDDQNSQSGGVTGLNTSDMQGSSSEGNMTELDFQNTWKTVPGDYPELQWQD